MSTYDRKEVICGCCGEKTTVTGIGSTHSFGCDLDLRPGPAARMELNHCIHVCPNCGYANPILDESISGIENFVKSRRYIECDGICVKNELAKNFIRWGLICAERHNLEEETMAYLYAAWACDDEKEEEAAILLRTKCELLLKRLMKKRFGRDYRLLDADLLRRSKQFDKVIRRYSFAPVFLYGRLISKGLKFEVKKAKEKDTKTYMFTMDDSIVPYYKADE